MGMTLMTCAGSTSRQHTGSPWLCGEKETVVRGSCLEELAPLQTADGSRGQGEGGWRLEVSRPSGLCMQGEEQQQEVLTQSLGQRYRQGTVKVERAEPGNGGLTKFTH